MASINVTKKDFPDLVIAFLLDKMMKGDKIMSENEEFNDLIKIMERKGLKPHFLHYYLSSKSSVRSKYKIFSKALVSGKSESGAIYISAWKDDKKKKKGGLLKSLIKKSLKVVNASKKRSGFPLSEEKVDKILDKLLIDEGYTIKDKE